ncbi:hypothetical protein GCM10007938_12290 [Vibrio zhanjiangensis]|uniref:Uncharacterized protein n=1 Tax=Vibrio zhanjiangensis TaxID=1046128 RepID=A0ABQ6EW76_9VIBR|nr:hypothetical protein [Vibrio zhanjiangensis]GLT17452.1 hypothetical protein GCM10007938_12290 [Vibrio zhanjiangensis]
MINVFEGFIGRNTPREKGDFERILSETDQESTQAGSSPLESDKELSTVSHESGLDYQMAMALKNLSSFEKKTSDEIELSTTNRKHEIDTVMATGVAGQPSFGRSEYPLITINKVMWHSSVPITTSLDTKQNTPISVSRDDKIYPSVKNISSNTEAVKFESSSSLLGMAKTPLAGEAKAYLGSLSRHFPLQDVGLRSTHKVNQANSSTSPVDIEVRQQNGMKFSHQTLVTKGGIIYPLPTASISGAPYKLGDAVKGSLASHANENSTTIDSVSSVSSIMKPTPLSGMALPNYHLAPDIFWQYPRVNSYVVLYRSKYYLFEFDEHKMINYLEYSDDRN